MKLCFKLLSTTTHFVGDEVKNCTNIPYSKQFTNLKHFAQTYLINRCFYSFGIFAAKTYLKNYLSIENLLCYLEIVTLEVYKQKLKDRFKIHVTFQQLTYDVTCFVFAFLSSNINFLSSSFRTCHSVSSHTCLIKTFFTFYKNT